MFGLQIDGEIAYGTSLDRTKEHQVTAAWGVAFDCDLYAKSSVPIGFLLGYYHTNYDDALVVNGLPLQFLLQINYTGRDDFEFGLAINYQNMKESEYDTNLQFINLSTIFKYYF